MSLLFILLVFHSKYSQKSYLFIEVKLLKEKKTVDIKYIFFPKTCVPQLLAPLNLMFCAASLCQDNSSESSPIMRDEVGEQRARDLRPFLHTVSLQILQIPRSTFVDTPLQLITNILWGLGGGGTVMAMAKPLFCGRRTIFVLILRCASDHCPAGRSNHGPFQAYWRGLLGFHLISAGIWSTPSHH